MDPVGPPSSLFFPPIPPSETLHSLPHDEKASKTSFPANSAQRPSPERQCGLACGPFEAELKTAITLMTFRRYPMPALAPFPYPSDSMTGERIPVGNLIKYSKAHLWPDDIHCFCALRPGGEMRSVHLVVPTQDSVHGLPCLRCPDWTPDGMGGCSYLVDLKQLLDRSDAMFGSEVLLLQNFPLRAPEHTEKILVSSVTCPPPSAASSTSVPAYSPVESSASSVQVCPSPTFRVKPGAVTDSKRIWSPPPPRDVFGHVEDMPLPAAAEVQEVFDEMVNGSGVSYRRLMAVIGKCMVCDHVMALPNIAAHPCIGRTKNTGPCPSRSPLLPEDRRILPAAGSCMKELDVEQVVLEVDDDNDDDDDDVEIADDVDGAPKRKRKTGFNTPPSQRVFVSGMKKARTTNKGGPTQTTPVLVKMEVEPIDISRIPFRIPTPEGSREVYRDGDEEFIMYEKA